jgi:hypothetical protein
LRLRVSPVNPELQTKAFSAVPARAPFPQCTNGRFCYNQQMAVGENSGRFG